MRLVDAAKPTFARHETFHPRYGWFRKAHEFVAMDPRIFVAADAPVRIGVGKNMVRAIRFWGLAAKLIEEDPQSSNRRARNLVPTEMGRRLFEDNGWDRYMEDPGTVWLLHWLLMAPPCLLPVWWLAFNDFHAVEFTEDDLLAAVTAQLEATEEWSVPHQSSVSKDVTALLHTYAPAERSSRRTGIEDLLDCPLRELSLLGRSPRGYRFRLGPKPSLPSAILAYAALNYIACTGAGSHSVTISRLAHETGAPGKVFKLTEGELLTAMAPIVDRIDSLRLSATMGTVQFSWSKAPNEIATQILDDYFRSATCDFRAHFERQPPRVTLEGG